MAYCPFWYRAELDSRHQFGAMKGPRSLSSGSHCFSVTAMMHLNREFINFVQVSVTDAGSQKMWPQGFGATFSVISWLLDPVLFQSLFAVCICFFFITTFKEHALLNHVYHYSLVEVGGNRYCIILRYFA